MASFPTAAKTFTTRSAGQTIAASHVNDLQDEVTAIEEGIVNGTAPINTSNVTVRRSSTRGVKIGSYFDLRELDTDGSTSILGSASAGASVMSYNAVWNAGSSRWEARAGGRSNALLMQEGSAWMLSGSSIAGGAGSPINWRVQQKWYADPSFNIGIGPKFDGSLSTGTVGGEPQGTIHTATEGNHNVVLECAGDNGGTNASANTVTFRKSRGTLAVPLKVETGDAVGGLVFTAKAHNGTNDHLQVGSIAFSVDAATTAAQRPSAKAVLQTSSNNGTVSERLIVTGKGTVTLPSQPRCNVFSTAVQSIADGSTAAITFEAETFDVGGLHSTATDPDRVTIPTGSSGVYWVHFQALCSTGARALFHICKNSSRERSIQRHISTVYAEVVEVSGLFVLDGGDIINVTAVGDGSSIAVGLGGTAVGWHNRLQVQKVS